MPKYNNPRRTSVMSNQAMILRNIEADDIEACAVLFTQVFSSEPWNEPWNIASATERLFHFYQSKGFIGVLAVETESVVGFALGNTEPFHFGSMFYLREMCTQASLQNQGIGRKILDALEKVLMTKKVSRIYLTTEKAIPAAIFYQKNDFNYDDKIGLYTKHINS